MNCGRRANQAATAEDFIAGPLSVTTTTGQSRQSSSTQSKTSGSPSSASAAGFRGVERGDQFRSRAFRAVLAGSKLTGSMGRVSSAGDNAAMESFFSLLKKNVLNRRQVWRTRPELRYEIVHWIEHTYNRRRRQRGLGRLTPVEFELALPPRTHPPLTRQITHNHSQPKSRQTPCLPPRESVPPRRASCSLASVHT